MTGLQILINPTRVKLEPFLDEMSFSLLAVVDEEGQRLATIAPWYNSEGHKGFQLRDGLTGCVYSISRDSAFEPLEGLEPQAIMERLLNLINLTQFERPKID